jgi:hypothetical protein
MVDYSKWDNLDLDDSDDEAPPERLKGQPRVTRLDPGTRVTMGPEGITAVAPPQAAGKAPATAKQAALVDAARSAAAAPPAKKQGGALDYSKWDTLEVSDSDDGEEEEEDEGLEQWAETQSVAAAAAGKRWPGMDEHAPAQGATATAAAAPPPAAAPAPETSAAVRPSKLSRNGGRTQRYMWSQEKQDVSVSVLAPAGTSAKAVVVVLEEKHIKVGVTDGKGASGRTWLISGQLYHPVEAPTDPTDIDWEIRDLSPEEYAAQLLAGDETAQSDGQAPAAQRPRVIVVSFKKKVPHGVVLWWKGLLKGDATIDVTKIAGRGAVNKDAASAWAQAHAQFQENVAKRVPVEL